MTGVQFEELILAYCSEPPTEKKYIFFILRKYV